MENDQALFLEHLCDLVKIKTSRDFRMIEIKFYLFWLVIQLKTITLFLT